jgi:hypothetical protein
VPRSAGTSCGDDALPLCPSGSGVVVFPPPPPRARNLNPRSARVYAKGCCISGDAVPTDAVPQIAAVFIAVLTANRMNQLGVVVET